MNIKLFELRDAATFVPVFAFKTTSSAEREHYLLRRSGFSPDGDLVILGRLECSGVDRNCTYDPYAWGMSRTFQIAHHYIAEHFDDLTSGQVIDVEFILGERATPKESEAASENTVRKALGE